jgi:phosphatidylserine decarboxylase
MFARDYGAMIFMIVGFVAGGLIIAFDYTWGMTWPWYLICLFFFIPAICILIFFRDPPRRIGEGYVSPADGKVIIIDRKSGYHRVCVFMSPLNVHVNRAPCDGKVTDMKYHEGAFAIASSKEAEENERMHWYIKGGQGKVEVVQIAGTIARRIVSYLEVGAEVKKGDRIGHIAFGSRVDLYLPKKVKLEVEVGQRVKAGSTTIGR